MIIYSLYNIFYSPKNYAVKNSLGASIVSYYNI